MSQRPGEAFGQLLRSHRLAAGMTQEELAERSLLSVRGISDLERGLKAHPRFPTVRMLADALRLNEADRRALVVAAAAGAIAVDDRAPRRAGLPRPLDPLIDREGVSRAIEALLSDDTVRLVTLTGTGGVGKTRLAIDAALRAEPRFRDGATFVSLASVRDPGLAPATIARALGIQDGDETADDPLDDIIRDVGDLQLLLVLDNLEHILAIGPWVTSLLLRLPRFKVLATSRVLLRVRGEHDVPVPPLGVPDPSEDRQPDLVQSFPAVQLFLARAKAAAPNLETTESSLAAAAAICRNLDGLPLAIELAAARANSLPPEQLLPWLDQRLPLLTSGAQDLPDRHRTMRDAISWSYDLLLPTEQAFFRRLSAFRGGFTIEAAHDVASPPGSSPLPTLNLISSLVDKNLLMRRADVCGNARYGTLETLHEFAQEQLQEEGEEREVRQRHAAWAGPYAESCFLHGILVDCDEAPLLLDADLDNFRLALSHCIAHGEIAPGLRIVGGLWHYWSTRSLLREGLAWASALAPEVPSPEVDAPVMGLIGCAWLNAITDNGTLALGFARDALRRTHHGQSPELEPLAYVMVSLSLSASQEYEGAVRVAEEGLASLTRHPGSIWEPWLLNRLGVALSVCERHHEAIPLKEQALELWRDQGFGWGIGTALSNLGWDLKEIGEWPRALPLYKEMLSLDGHPGDIWGVLNVWLSLAEIAVEIGDHRRAALLLGAGEAQREAIGITLLADEQTIRRRLASRIADAAGKATLEGWLTEGRALPLLDAIYVAFDVGTEPQDQERLVAQ